MTSRNLCRIVLKKLERQV
ncbi:hypothetical protein KIPB_008376, partial [Kipferlia bialata]|eukprot:g8376.t1